MHVEIGQLPRYAEECLAASRRAMGYMPERRTILAAEQPTLPPGEISLAGEREKKRIRGWAVQKV
jgi:hypothetical protein